MRVGVVGLVGREEGEVPKAFVTFSSSLRRSIYGQPDPTVDRITRNVLDRLSAKMPPTSSPKTKHEISSRL